MFFNSKILILLAGILCTFSCPSICLAEEALTLEDLILEQQQTTPKPARETTPKHMALLLPLTGTLSGPGNAVKDGFMAAYNGQQVSEAINVRLYDTASQDAVGLYQQALADGADMIIGPLTKQDVAAVAALNHPVPTLLLNRPLSKLAVEDEVRGDTERRTGVYTQVHEDSSTVSTKQFASAVEFRKRSVPMEDSQNIYHLCLSPQNEAIEVAKRARGDGFSKGLIIAPAGAWGEDIVKTFTLEWQEAGGEIVDKIFYSQAALLNPLLHDFLRVTEIKIPPKTSLSGAKHTIEIKRREDFDMIFLLAYPSKARQIVPLLKYYYVGSVPVYATSSVYSGSPNKINDKDLDGLIFCDTPWIFTHAIPNKNWPETFNSYSRLYALGMDSFAFSAGIQEESGVFYATTGKKLSRELIFKQFSRGVAGDVCRNRLG